MITTTLPFLVCSLHIIGFEPFFETVKQHNIANMATNETGRKLFGTELENPCV